MPSIAVPFSIVTAFSSEITGGNPAAIAFHDTHRPAKELGAIAKTLKQPILAVVSPWTLPSDLPKTQTREIRFFTPKEKSQKAEPPVCGHGILAASNAVFSLPEVASTDIDTIVFKNPSFGLTFKATKLDGGFIEISVPAPATAEIDEAKTNALKTRIDKAFKHTVNIREIKTGGDLLPFYCMFVLEDGEDLAGCDIDESALLGSGFIVHIITVKSPDPKFAFYSRMFAPAALFDEDAACGSAHGLLGPYWHKQLGIRAGTEVHAKQVSERGGYMRLIWEPDQGTVRLRGETAVLASGVIHSPVLDENY